MKEFKKLNPLLKKPLFHAWEARRKGIHTSLLSYYAKKGWIQKLDRGIYCGQNQNLNIDFKWEDLILTAKSIPKGVICLTSALAVYNLTEEIPRFFWIAVPNSTRAPKRKGVKIVRMRNFTTGKTKIKCGQTVISIYNRERAIVDAFRFLGKETAIKSLKKALQVKGNNKLDLRKLQSYSKKLRYDLTTYILTATT